MNLLEFAIRTLNRSQEGFQRHSPLSASAAQGILFGNFHTRWEVLGMRLGSFEHFPRGMTETFMHNLEVDRWVCHTLHMQLRTGRKSANPIDVLLRMQWFTHDQVFTLLVVDTHGFMGSPE